MRADLKYWRRGTLERLDRLPPTTYKNVAIAPDGTLRAWPGIKTTTRPPILKTDGQITWLNRESAPKKRSK